MGLRGIVSTLAGYGAVPRNKKYVSKWTHGFFITINSMILYFKHIIHIDDFQLNGHPPSYDYFGLDSLMITKHSLAEFSMETTFWLRVRCQCSRIRCGVIGG